MSITMADLATDLSRKAARLDNELDKEVARVAEVGVGLMKRSIQKYHAVDTSTMLNSTSKQRIGKHTWQIGPTVDYAVYVAEGTRYMPGRPFHRDSAKELDSRVQVLDIGKRLGLKG